MAIEPVAPIGTENTNGIRGIRGIRTDAPKQIEKNQASAIHQPDSHKAELAKTMEAVKAFSKANEDEQLTPEQKKAQDRVNKFFDDYANDFKDDKKMPSLESIKNAFKRGTLSPIDIKGQRIHREFASRDGKFDKYHKQVIDIYVDEEGAIYMDYTDITPGNEHPKNLYAYWPDKYAEVIKNCGNDPDEDWRSGL